MPDPRNCLPDAPAPMKWLRFQHNGRPGFGRLLSSDAAPEIEVFSGDLFDSPMATGERVALSSVALLTPVVPGKIIGLWNNFHQLAVKLGQDRPAEPLFFLKPSSALLAPGGVICNPTGYDGRVAYEGELGIVIGRRCRNLSPAQAPTHIFGYTIVNDVTALDLLTRDPSFAQWTRAKGCDTFCPVGPVLATGLDWATLTIRTLVNGRERQNYPASDMIIDPPQLVAALSREMTLEPGDLVACGTSVGVLPMRDGTRVEVAIEGIGTLVNHYGQAGDSSSKAEAS